MDEMYNKHYIKVDSSDRVVDGWSDGPFCDKDPTDAICINDKGSYQFRLFPGGEANPSLFEWEYMIPIYKYKDGQIEKRTEEEIAADIAALPEPEPIEPPDSVWDELDAAYQEGVDSV